MSISESILEPPAAAGDEVVLSSTAVELDWADLCIRTDVAVSEPDAADFALLLRGIAGDDGAGLWISADKRGIGRGFFISACAFSYKSFNTSASQAGAAMAITTHLPLGNEPFVEASTRPVKSTGALLCTLP